MLFLLWTFIDIVGRWDKVPAKWEKRVRVGSVPPSARYYGNMQNR